MLAFPALSLAGSYKLHHDVEKRNIQYEHLMYGYDVGIRTGIDHPDIGYIFSAIIWQESGAGLDTGFNKKGHKAYGVYQNYITTVERRFRQKGLTSYSRSEIMELLKDRDFSATMAIEELSDWLKYHKGNMDRSIASYYSGFAWKKHMHYSRSVMNRVAYMKKNFPFLEDRTIDPME